MEQSALERDFDRDGFVVLRAAIDAEAVASMLDSTWGVLEEVHGLRRHDPASWTLERPSGLQALRRSGALASMVSPALRAAVDTLLDEGRWECPKSGAGAIPCFPRPGASAGEWDVPASLWHSDNPGHGDPGGRFGARALATLQPLASRSGGTLVLAGSPRLVAGLVAAGGAGARRSFASGWCASIPGCAI